VARGGIEPPTLGFATNQSLRVRKTSNCVMKSVYEFGGMPVSSIESY